MRETSLLLLPFLFFILGDFNASADEQTAARLNQARSYVADFDKFLADLENQDTSTMGQTHAIPLQMSPLVREPKLDGTQYFVGQARVGVSQLESGTQILTLNRPSLPFAETFYDALSESLSRSGHKVIRINPFHLHSTDKAFEWIYLKQLEGFFSWDKDGSLTFLVAPDPLAVERQLFKKVRVLADKDALKIIFQLYLSQIKSASEQADPLRSLQAAYDQFLSSLSLEKFEISVRTVPGTESSNVIEAVHDQKKREAFFRRVPLIAEFEKERLFGQASHVNTLNGVDIYCTWVSDQAMQSALVQAEMERASNPDLPYETQIVADQTHVYSSLIYSGTAFENRVTDYLQKVKLHRVCVFQIPNTDKRIAFKQRQIAEIYALIDKIEAESKLLEKQSGPENPLFQTLRSDFLRLDQLTKGSSEARDAYVQIVQERNLSPNVETNESQKLVFDYFVPQYRAAQFFAELEEIHEDLKWGDPTSVVSWRRTLVQYGGLHTEFRIFTLEELCENYFGFALLDYVSNFKSYVDKGLIVSLVSVSDIRDGIEDFRKGTLKKAARYCAAQSSEIGRLERELISLNAGLERVKLIPIEETRALIQREIPRFHVPAWFRWDNSKEADRSVEVEVGDETFSPLPGQIRFKSFRSIEKLKESFRSVEVEVEAEGDTQDDPILNGRGYQGTVSLEMIEDDGYSWKLIYDEGVNRDVFGFIPFERHGTWDEIFIRKQRPDERYDTPGYLPNTRGAGGFRRFTLGQGSNRYGYLFNVGGHRVNQKNDNFLQIRTVETELNGESIQYVSDVIILGADEFSPVELVK